MSAVNNKPIVSYTNNSSTMHVYAQKNLTAHIQRIIQDSFKAQLRDYNHFHQYGMGDIVVLVGTSTAGKTSIIKALKQLEYNRLEDGNDLRSEAIDLKVMTKYNPDEIRILKEIMNTPSDIPKAIVSKERSWKTEVTVQEKIEAEEAIQRIKKTGDSFSSEEKEDIDNAFQNMELEIFDDAFECSRKGRDIIFDVLRIDALIQHVLMRNFSGPLRVALTYCPFHILSSRMEKRNKEAIERGAFTDQRIGEFPLIQFSEIYTQKKNGQKAFERLTREQVTKTFHENFDKGTMARREIAHIEGRTFPSEEELSEQKRKSLAHFLINLGFKEGIDAVEVAPRNAQFYNLFIDSNTLSPHESARLIHNGTHQRYRLDSNSKSRRLAI